MKIKRHQKIKELVKNFHIETQEELSEELKKSGFDVTQATISRDIRELKLTKIVTNNGNQKYDIVSTNTSDNSEKFIGIVKQGVISMDYTQNMLIIKTLTGMAMGVATGLDSMHNSKILGSIAGDDTIFCAVRNENDAIEIISLVNDVIKS